MKLTPIKEFAWTNDRSEMYMLTCINHTSAQYLTKNPFDRSIHLMKLPEGEIERTDTGECVCPFSDLAVVEEV